MGGAVLLALALALPGPAARAQRSSKPSNYCAHVDGTFKGRARFVGMSDLQVEQGSASYQNCSLGWMAAEGISNFRVEFDWLNVEPRPGQLDLSYYDTFVANAARHHIAILGLLNSAPGWASTKPTTGALSGTYPPAHPAQFGTFAAWMAKRYGPGGSFWRANPALPYDPVRAWEIWNEPDLAPYWEPKPNMRAYVTLLKDSYTAIKHVDRHAFILTGGMPFFANSDETHFISALYRFGGRRYFDAFAIHPYSTTMAEAEEHMLTARRVMDRFGDTSKPIWVTEVSWAGGDPDGFITNPRKQRASVITFFKFIEKNRARLRVQKVFWYMWQDQVLGSGPTNWWGFNEGLLDFSGHPKPALSALAAAARRLDR
jgi:hypothetical protein